MKNREKITPQEKLRRQKLAEHREKIGKREADARRKVAQAWAKIGEGKKYRKAAAREASRATTAEIRAELFDGILLQLSPSYADRSIAIQKRVLRRIVEKRQAQAMLRETGRSDDLFASYIACRATSRCMRRLRQVAQGY